MSQPDSLPSQHLKAILYHVFVPLQLPQKDAGDAVNHEVDIALCELILDAAQKYKNLLPEEQQALWAPIPAMLQHLQAFTTFRDKESIVTALQNMECGDVCVFHIRAQNAGLIIRHKVDVMVYEAFEVSPRPKAVMSAVGKLICSYPGHAASVSLDIAADPYFIESFASFLVEMDIDPLDATPTTTKAGSTVTEERDTADPKYISHFLMGILRGLGVEAQVERIVKRIGDDVLWDNAFKPWRRSPLWLVIRVAIQTSSPSRDTYKAFMIFFQSHLLRHFLHHDFSSDLLSLTLKKTARRVHKLIAATPPFVVDEITTVSRTVHAHLQRIWTGEQERQAKSVPWKPNREDIASAIELTLPNSREYLTNILQSPPSYDSVSSFHPSETRRLQVDDSFELCKLSRVNQDDGYLALFDFESMVESHLDDWVTRHAMDTDACSVLTSCLDEYVTCATKLYEGSPENESIRLLTIMHLWVALDKTAVSQIPLLREYLPEIPSTVLEPLLLRHSSQIERADYIERYLRRRHAIARLSSCPSIFSASTTSKSFSVRYFDANSAMQELKQRIEDDANGDRNRKLVELREKNETRASLLRQANGLSHTQTRKQDGTTHHKKKSCQKCKLETRAKAMRIGVHEWPLPTKKEDAKSVIFENLTPQVFMLWRDVTYRILHDLAMLATKSKSANQHGLANKGLSRWTGSPRLGRITIASSTKSFQQAHYHDIKLPSTETLVCVKNGFTFRLFDRTKDQWAISSFTPSLAKYCKLKLLPDSPYVKFRSFVETTTHTSNDVITAQTDCPDDISVHEFIAFGSLRSGGLLQWLNIVRELRADIMAFNREETHTLVLQAIWELGPLTEDGSQRSWHHELGEIDFGLLIAQECASFASRTKSNWLQGVSQLTIVRLMTRMLSSSPTTVVKEAAFSVLHEVRETTYGWMCELISKLRNTHNDDEVRELQRHLCEMAIICKMTYDVDPQHIAHILHTPRDITILVHCSATIQSSTPTNSSKISLHLKRLLDCNRRLSHFLENRLYDTLSSDTEGLDSAISSLWPTYCRSSEGWRRGTGTESRWMISTTDAQFGQRSQVVLFNLLTGLLLIDGQALDRLPQDIVTHPTYVRLFDQSILGVVPSNLPGMDFMTQDYVSGYKVSFALKKANNQTSALNNSILKISAQSLSGDIFELIPHSELAGDFPRFFVSEHVHWFNLVSREIEFRALDRPWQSSFDSWTLHFDTSGLSSLIRSSMGTTQYHIDIHSQTFDGICNRLVCLENPDFLTATYSLDTDSILVDLPRFRLKFIVDNEGYFSCQNLPGMIIDSNQSSGTMIGLHTQLLLTARDTVKSTLPRSRCTIIPYGDVVFSRTSDQQHVIVRITLPEEQRHIVWHEFRIDNDLGCLVDSTNLTARLYRIYLHALCNYPLPDPLTGQTGAEQALHDLSSSGSFSFQNLTSTDTHLLRLIKSLTPSRHFYPSHLRVMQTVDWSASLPASSQLVAFTDKCCDILRHGQLLYTLFATSESSHDTDIIDVQAKDIEGDDILLERARRRELGYGFAIGRSAILPRDKVYDARDSSGRLEVDFTPAKFAHLVWTWPYQLHRPFRRDELLSLLKSWGDIHGSGSRDVSLAFSGHWFKLPLPDVWLPLYDALRTSSSHPSTRTDLIFSLSAIAYGSPQLQHLIPILLAFACIPDFRDCVPPSHEFYHLADGFDPTFEEVYAIVLSKAYSLDMKPNNVVVAQHPYESAENHHLRRLDAYEEATESRAQRIASAFMAEWSSSTPSSAFHVDDFAWFRVEDIVLNVRLLFENRSRNVALRAHILRVENILYNHAASLPRPIPGFISTQSLTTQKQGLQFGNVYLTDLFTRPFGDVCYLPNVNSLALTDDDLVFENPADTGQLKSLLDELRNDAENQLGHLYADRLERSRMDLEGRLDQGQCRREFVLHDFITHREQCQARLQHTFDHCALALSPSSHSEEVLLLAGLWPRVSSRNLLESLASSSGYPATTWMPACRQSLILLARTFIEYQRSQRLVEFFIRKDMDSLVKELRNSCAVLGRMEYTDWLLIQIDGNFLARPVQLDVAEQMIAPSSGRSTVLQLNMGEGKSSVIGPFVAASLADTHNLVRMVVLRALSKQMFQLLVERLSGLCNRRIFYIPFSRDVQTTASSVQNIRHIFQECARVQGVLVTQPEHILSLRLMAVERLLSPSVSSTITDELRKVEEWLADHSRDILDESDEILHVKYQLVYTSGHQQAMQNSPDRWITIQHALDRVRIHAQDLRHSFPTEVELTSHSAEQFPSVRIMGEQAARRLISLVADDVMSGRLENFILVSPNGEDAILTTTIRDFITKTDITEATYNLVRSALETTGLWYTILLIRGLLAHGILLHVLSQRRWRVDYGLDPSRSMLAVPYRAKDVPTLRAEFGHPEVAICLTCLSYYYGGLTELQVRECFGLLLKLDDPQIEYEAWVRRGMDAIPSALRQINGVNTRDAHQFTERIVPLFSKNQALIDFFLSKVVFPRYAKEFPKKIATSAWDLAETKTNLTTGFSGTNDNSLLLPTSIEQHDPLDQLRTNAQVLMYLLHSENARYLCTAREDGQPCTVADFLQALVHETSEVRVLLDVGAQMLELKNKELVKLWLSLRTDLLAGIYFDDADRLTVLSQDGRTEPLVSSPLRQQMDRCLVYLDDAHTRGTDLKLPQDFRAAVTLGPKVTKDRLVQGCMRMRRLGHGQSVMFCAPLEVDRRIRKVGHLSVEAPIQVIDVLRWSMSESCTEILHNVPHWAAQGMDYERRMSVALGGARSSRTTVNQIREAWLQPEARTLEELYGYTPPGQSLKHQAYRIPSLRDRFDLLGVSDVHDARIEEEQEREVSQEIEQERQVQRPRKASPATHALDYAVRHFIDDGIVDLHASAFVPLLKPLRKQNSQLTSIHPWTERLFATRDFATTTSTRQEFSQLTDYLRPVHWIVSARQRDGSLAFVAMSPFEVNILLPNIRSSKVVRLHMYTPRVTLSMNPIDHLDFYCIPPLSSDSSAAPSLDTRCLLNLWAGQLYLDEYATYIRLCLLLGLSRGQEAGSRPVEHDRYIKPQHQSSEMRDVCLFQESPVMMLKELLGLRRKGMSYARTDMGKILQGRLLFPEDFDARG